MAAQAILRLAGLFALILSLAACGFKGPPKPLLQPLPAAPQALSARQFGSEMQLSWSLPQKNQDGTPLTDLAGFDIYRMSYDPAADCPECRDTSVLIERLELGYLRNARREGNRIFYLDRGVEAGSGYRYRVVPFTANRQTGAPGQIQQRMAEPPPAPGELVAEAHDRLIRLSWTATSPEAPGQVLLGYNVYRRSGNEAFSRLPINRALLTVAGFDDFEVVNAVNYGYQVTSVVRTLGGQAESAPSPTAEATPEAGR